jgi:hypothetical protein
MSAIIDLLYNLYFEGKLAEMKARSFIPAGK